MSKREFGKDLVYLTISAGFAFLWMLTSRTDWQLLATDGRQILSTTVEALNEYKHRFGIYPTHLSKLRTLSPRDLQASLAFDEFGRRLRYTALGRDYFVLSSFGPSGLENTAKRHSEMMQTNLPAQMHAVKAQGGSPNSLTSIFIALEGMTSPDGRWIVRRFDNAATDQRLLVTRSADRPELLLIAKHPQVNEFLFPNRKSNGLIFSAEATGERSAGLFWWDLTRNEITPLTLGQSATFNDNIGESAQIILTQASPFQALALQNHARHGDLEAEKDALSITIERWIDNTPLLRWHATNRPEDEWFIGLPTNLDCNHGSSIQHRWCKLAATAHESFMPKPWIDFLASIESSFLFPYAAWTFIHLLRDNQSRLQPDAQTHKGDIDHLRVTIQNRENVPNWLGETINH